MQQSLAAVMALQGGPTAGICDLRFPICDCPIGNRQSAMGLRLADGTVFDTSAEGDPIEFVVGEGEDEQDLRFAICDSENGHNPRLDHDRSWV